MKNLSPINENKDVVTKEYVDSKVAFYDGRVSRSTNTDTTNCWVKIAECEAPNSTAQIMDEITLYPNTTDSAVKTTCKVRVEGKGAYASTWKLHIIDSTKDFNSNKVKLIYDKNIVDNKRKIELWGYNINGWDGFHSQKTFGNNYTLTYGLKCLTSQNKFATTYLHDNFAEAPTIDISIKSLVNEGLTSLENDIAINRTTLGTQCKNLLNWKNANADGSSNVTYTKTDNDITTTSNGSWGRVVYKLPALEIGTKYTFSAAVSDLSQASATARIRIAYNLEGTNKIIDINLTEDGEYKADFTPTESTVYVLFYPNFSANTYTNSFTASDIMLRYADIIDDTYEPYQPSVQEQTPYSISVSGKSTSAAISYSGVPTLICLTPNTADSTAGGLYMINSAGTVVKLIEKTGIVVAADTSSNTFTITNNTSTVMDVCISRCWGR